MIQQLYQEKELYLENSILNAKMELEKIRATRKESAQHGGIEKWLGFTFESSSNKTQEYMAFVKDYRREMKTKLTGAFEMLPKTSDAHFEASGFVKNIKTGKLAYWSISDIRNWRDDWYKNILIRTAQHDKDWTGGTNNYTDWPNMLERLLKITS